MMYVVRQLFDSLASPLVIALAILLLAAVVRARGRARLAAGCTVTAILLLYCASLLPVGDWLLGGLERQFPPLATSGALPRVDYVVVLGSSYSPRADISVVAALDDDGLVRVIEGIRLARKLGPVRLVVSGGAPQGRVPSALGYARMAHELGVDDKSVIVLNGSLNTRDEARAIAALLGKNPFVLVTSAYHMPRAMRLLRSYETKPIPAPTGQQTGAAYAHVWNYFLPTSAGLRQTERALHEYIGEIAVTLGLG